MKKYLQVAKWEYLERIKNKSYIFMTFIFPLLVFGIVLIPTLLIEKEDAYTKVIGLIEKNISVTDELEKILSEYKTKDGQPSYIIRKISSDQDIQTTIKIATNYVNDKSIEGFVFIEKVSSDSFLVEYHTQKVTNIKDISRLEKAISQVITNEKLKELNLNAQRINELTKPTSLKLIKVTEKGKENLDTEKVFLGTFFFIMFLMMSLIMSAGLLVRSVVEEKSNRIIEILVSSCSTNDLMAGKILGLSALGITQILVWFVLAISIGGPIILNYIQIQDPLFSMVYFVLGYIFYSSLFIGLGAIGNNEQESQSIMSVVSLLIFIPIFLAGQIIDNPESTMGKYFSYFPLTTSPMMMMRINITDVTLLEKVITLIILIISIFASIWFSGKIFRVAILSYGKTPNINEIIKWLKSK